MFARLLIVWLIVGQAIYVCWPHFTSRPPSLLELEYAHNPSPANQAALEKELNRVADFESKRAIGLITLLLAVDGVIIGFLWNFGAKRDVLKKEAGR
jgi:hypothetical protein